MQVNIKDVLRKRYEKQDFSLLLTDCKKIREEKVNEFIKNLENQAKEGMTKGKVKVVKRGTALHIAEKDRIIRHFTTMGFDIDYHPYSKRGLTVGCKFTVQWQHLIK